MKVSTSNMALLGDILRTAASSLILSTSHQLGDLRYNKKIPKGTAGCHTVTRDDL